MPKPLRVAPNQGGDGGFDLTGELQPPVFRNRGENAYGVFDCLSNVYLRQFKFETAGQDSRQIGHMIEQASQGSDG